jgi:phosphoenolpyruvate synthase/pyruvate phosphate dikinase
MYTITFQDISSKDVKIVGGKGAALGELIHAGFPVPQGFVITTKAYQSFHDKNLPNSFKEEIERAFDALKAQRVAVRSSAIAEDSPIASWAGQLESYLNVTKENLFENIQTCWYSVKNARAQSYAKDQNIEKERLAIAVVIQKMIDSEVSGVMFTQNPVNNNSNEIVVESCYGLGELLVQGLLTPDNFIITKDTFAIKKIFSHNQMQMLVYKDGKQKQVNIPKEWHEKSTLINTQLENLTKLAKRIENYFGKPQDIEWAIEVGKIYITQARPITTLS